MSIDTHEPATPQDPSEFWAIAAGATGDISASQAISPNEEQVSTNQASGLEDSSLLGATSTQADNEQAPMPTGAGSSDETTPPAAPVSVADKRFWTTPKKVLAGVVTTALVGGGVGAAVGANGSNSKPKAAASHSQPYGNASKQPTTVPSPQNTPTSLPSHSETTVTPTTTEPVPYIEGQPITKDKVRMLMQNLDASVNNNDLDDLLNSGLYPNSEFASNWQVVLNRYQMEKRQVGALVHYFVSKINDNDILIDPTTPNTVIVRAAEGTDFDFQYDTGATEKVTYNEFTLHLGHGVVSLPSGQSEDIVTIVDCPIAQISYQDWYNGFHS